MTTPRPHAAPASPLDAVLPRPHFTERHSRLVHASADVAWAAATSVTPGEVRAVGPLMALRSLPRILVERRVPRRRPGGASFLETFEEGGFVELHRDEHVVDGRAAAVYGAAGMFWSPSGNAPLPLADARAFAEHRGPGTVKAAFSLEVVEGADGTLVTTETRIVGTDAGARRSFGRYWLIIRGPSGLIRRSWLAAIDRRARA